MNILIVGSGGREHAIALSLVNDSRVNRICVNPGNPGMLMHSKISISSESILEIASEFDLVIIGPEAPIASGLSDQLRAIGVNVFAPSFVAGQLESSKIFAKKIMSKAKVPTAPFSIIAHIHEARERIIEHLDESGVVVKADGLASGKGVVVCKTLEEALLATQQLFKKYGGPLLVEKRVKGQEVSALFLCLEENFLCLGHACDHKRLHDYDLGPNTGGMGTYSPVPWLNTQHKKMIEERVVKPTLRQMKRDGMPFCGVLFVGLMVDQDDFNVLEYNVRFGDPETQALLPRLEWDALEAFTAVAKNDPDAFLKIKITEKPIACVHVVKASEGYPEQPIVGRNILMSDQLERSKVFFSAVKSQSDRVHLQTNGGRVFGVSGIGTDLKMAREDAYLMLQKITFEGEVFRRDIGAKL